MGCEKCTECENDFFHPSHIFSEQTLYPRKDQIQHHSCTEDYRIFIDHVDEPVCTPHDLACIKREKSMNDVE